MRLIKSSRKRMVLWIILSIVVVMAIVGIVFVNQPSFGRIPRGERLARIERSPNYRDGAFRNIHETPLMTSDKGRLRGLLDFVFKDKTGLQPDTALTVVKTDLRQINPEEDVLVWFGHSSYLVQVDGKRVLVDPVFCMASPVSFINKPFKGTDVYHPEDMPDIDYLVISSTGGSTRSVLSSWIGRKRFVWIPVLSCIVCRPGIFRGGDFPPIKRCGPRSCLKLLPGRYIWQEMVVTTHILPGSGIVFRV